MLNSGEKPSGRADMRNLGNGHSIPPSPLKLFGQAKKRINDIFKEIGEYIYESDNFIQSKLYLIFYHFSYFLSLKMVSYNKSSLTGWF